MNLSGASHEKWQALPLPGADLALMPQWLAPDQADALLATLVAEVPWETHVITLFGRKVAAPRLSCWMGDEGARYCYSGTQFVPRPWLPELEALRSRLTQVCGAPFNSVLANLYRSGEDAMGWHSDSEPELGRQPVIASLSLGAPRRFQLRARRARGGGAAADVGKPVSLELAHGSLLRMAGETQALYQHRLPRCHGMAQPRLNLTFRQIAAARPESL